MHRQMMTHVRIQPLNGTTTWLRKTTPQRWWEKFKIVRIHLHVYTAVSCHSDYCGHPHEAK